MRRIFRFSFCFLLCFDVFNYSESFSQNDVMIYWCDVDNNKLQRSNMDGSNIHTIIEGPEIPYRTAVDSIANKLYWLENGTRKIRRSNLDGTEIEDIITNIADNMRDIDLDLYNSKIYWSTL